MFGEGVEDVAVDRRRGRHGYSLGVVKSMTAGGATVAIAAARGLRSAILRRQPGAAATDARHDEP
jgi:hypothetical protein